MIDFTTYHINENGKKVAGTAHQIHLMALPSPFVPISKHKINPFIMLKTKKKNKDKDKK